jgi:tetratricopeptide (TPR) repeat protein
MIRLLALFWIFCIAPAAAQPAQDLFAAGEFSAAMEAARSLNTADGDALAARAALTVAAFEASDRPRAESLIDQAMKDANRALSRQATHVEATLQLAIATGYRAKLRQSPMLARQARKLMEQAMARAPGNAFAWAALGGWHGESVADLGGFIAGTVLGAKKAEAFRYYDGALERDPSSPTIHTFYAFNLVRLDEKAYSKRIKNLLTRAVALKPRDGFEQLISNQARDVLTALLAGETRRATVLTNLYQPFGKILTQRN